MISLLIVDDENGTRSGLLNHIAWEKLGIKMIQTAGSAEEAIKVCEAFEPDIVLSDIKMQEMNGIEMCRQLHEKFPICQIIFISGYADKAYLKAAIELGAVNYIEKPVNLSEVESAVKEACKRIHKRREQTLYSEMYSRSSQYVRRSVFFRLLDGSQTTVSENDLKAFGVNQLGPYLRVAILRMSDPITNINRFYGQIDNKIKIINQQQVSVLREFKDNRTLILLFSSQEQDVGNDSEIIQAYEDMAVVKFGRISMFIAFGKNVYGIDQLLESYDDALQILKSLFYTGYGNVRYNRRDPIIVRIDEKAIDDFRKAVSLRNIRGVYKALNEVTSSLEAMQAVKKAAVKKVYYTFYNHLLLEYGKLYADSDETIDKKREEMYQNFEEADTLFEINLRLRVCVEELFHDEKKEESNCSVITAAIRIINQEYAGKDMSVKMLAERVYLTPTYLSGLFKKKTGRTISEYITAVRIENAKHFLLDKQLKLYNIAEKVGYDDANYFAKIFKKHTGLTPSEYREKVL